MLNSQLRLIASFSVLVVVGVVLIDQPVFARDLGAAARAYTTTVKSIGQGMSVAGVIAGGICLQIPGVAHFGKTVLAAGLVGGLCSFGAPAFVSMLGSVFGTG